MEKTLNKTILVIFFILSLALTLPHAYAEEEEENIKDLGWLAVSAGILASLPFNIYNFIRRNVGNIFTSNSVEILKKLNVFYKPLLHFHITVNTAGALAALTHGYFLIRYLDGVALSLVIVVLTVMITGGLLMFTSSRSIKIFNRLIHSQVIITILLIILLIIHVSTAEE